MSGVVFPTGPDGRRSTSSTGTAVWADAVRDLDPGLAERITAAKDWRKAYVDLVAEVTAVSTQTPDGALTTARAGLASTHERMRFERGDASTSVLEAKAAEALVTQTVTGTQPRPAELQVPYGKEVLAGDTLKRRLDRWVDAGTVEPSFRDAITSVVDDPAQLDLSDLAFAVLGAGAELGPCGPLLQWGATVAAVDLPKVTDRLLGLPSAGTLLLPEGGVDLLQQTPEIAAWLEAVAPDKQLTVGSYAYADGATHVQVAVASDAVVQQLLGSRPGTAYAELATPTDAYAVPEELVEDARQRYAQRGWRSPLQALVPGMYQPAYQRTVTRQDGTTVGIADALVPQQGPNYTLAKRVQRWRALVSVADGHRVSANVAPATSTRSVTKNRLLAAAYAGASAFGVEVFAPQTARVLMAALLVHDLRAPQPVHAHPDDLLADQAAHGGMFRVGYSPRTVLPLAALKGLPSTVR